MGANDMAEMTPADWQRQMYALSLMQGANQPSAATTSPWGAISNAMRPMVAAAAYNNAQPAGGNAAPSPTPTSAPIYPAVPTTPAQDAAYAAANPNLPTTYTGPTNGPGFFARAANWLSPNPPLPPAAAYAAGGTNTPAVQTPPVAYPSQFGPPAPAAAPAPRPVSFVPPVAPSGAAPPPANWPPSPIAPQGLPPMPVRWPALSSQHHLLSEANNGQPYSLANNPALNWPVSTPGGPWSNPITLAR